MHHLRTVSPSRRVSVLSCTSVVTPGEVSPAGAFGCGGDGAGCDASTTPGISVTCSKPSHTAEESLDVSSGDRDDSPASKSLVDPGDPTCRGNVWKSGM